jgi:hypothetical protein
MANCVRSQLDSSGLEKFPHLTKIVTLWYAGALSSYTPSAVGGSLWPSRPSCARVCACLVRLPGAYICRTYRSLKYRHSTKNPGVGYLNFLPRYFLPLPRPMTSGANGPGTG